MSLTRLPTANELDAMDENELLLCIGREAVGDTAVTQGLGTLIDRGRAVMRDAEPKLKALFCDADGPKALLAELSHEEQHSAVVALIAGAGFGMKGAIIYIAALILRWGLKVYCGTA